MKDIGDGSFAPQRRKENKTVSDLADKGLLLTGEVAIETILAFALTRNLSPQLLFIMYQKAGLLAEDINTVESDHYPDIFRPRS